MSGLAQVAGVYDEPDVSTDRLKAPDLVVWILSALAVAFGTWALQVGWDHSILDLHQWRQSHTAISAIEIMRGGPLWRYLTPIVGPPWPSPIEFPLYQWIVGHLATPRTLETTGRAVSVAFFAATLVSYWFALDILEVRPRNRPVFMALALTSPLYLFWSRTFMIESAALFFAVTFLLAVHRATTPDATTAQRGVWLTIALAAGVLGAMVKVTTLVPWWTGAALLVLYRARLKPPSRPALVGIALGLAVPVMAGAGWLAFADVVKAENPLSARLAWSTVAWQHFGSLEMRFIPRSWYSVPGSTIAGYTRHTVVGSVVVFVAAWAATGLRLRRFALSVVCLALYFLPIAIFMHLYTAHVYYSYANSLLLVTIVGAGIVTLLERRALLSWIGVALFTAALVATTTNYLRGYYVDQQTESRFRWALPYVVDQRIPADDVIVIYGLNLATEFPYSAKRRAIMDWENRGAGDPAFERSLALLSAEGGHVGALVVCGDSRQMALVPKTIRRLAVSATPAFHDTYCDVYVAEDRMPEKDVKLPARRVYFPR